MTWAFSAKYWIVAYKVQLFQAETNIDSKAKLFAWILLGGGALFTLLTAIAFIPQILATIKSKKTDGDPRTFVYVLIPQAVVLGFSICFLVDGVLRLRRSIKEGETIRKRLIFIIILVYAVAVL